jgi:hypothetical protein
VKGVPHSLRNLFEAKERYSGVSGFWVPFDSAVFDDCPNHPPGPIDCEHVQGLIRLPDIQVGGWEGWTDGAPSPVEGRLVLSTNDEDEAGLYVLTQYMYLSEEHDPQAWRDGSVGEAVDVVDLTGIEPNHPGGLQAIGPVVAAAIECQGCDTASEIRFYTVDRFTIHEITNARLSLDGQEGKPLTDRASSVAVARLETGHYLVFVAGARSGASGGWFFVSRNRSLNDPAWVFVNEWEPECSDVFSDPWACSADCDPSPSEGCCDKDLCEDLCLCCSAVGECCKDISGPCDCKYKLEPRKGCFAGASNASFLVDCQDTDGTNLWFVAGDGPDTDSHSYVTLAKVLWDDDIHRVVLKPLELFRPEGADSCHEVPDFEITFRWGGNFFVTPSHTLSADISDREECDNQVRIQTYVPANAWDK